MRLSFFWTLVLVFGLIYHTALCENAPQDSEDNTLQDNESEEILKASPILNSDEYTPEKKPICSINPLIINDLLEKASFLR
jgi:hypothetical protein